VIEQATPEVSMPSPLVIAKALRAFVRLVRDPTRLDEVFVLAESVETPEAAAKIAEVFTKDPHSARVLRERPRLGEVDLAELVMLPEGTLGRTFADAMIRMNLDPKDILVPEHVASDFDFVRAHLRETHDVWHAATGFDTDVAGELGLQAFYLAQFEAPLSALLLMVGFANTLFYGITDRDRRMRAIVRGWLIGKRAEPFFGVRWAEMWSTPLVEVRRRLRVDPDLASELVDGFVSGRADTRVALAA
jgi:ubiquinone biosynthesis protein Coq4